MASESDLATLHLRHRASRYLQPLPDALLALILGVAAAFAFFRPEWLVHLPNEHLAQVMLFEGGFLFSQAALVDVATRLRKRPPLWLVAILAVSITFFTGGFAIFREAWHQGGVVFIPLLFSFAERASVLWRMPHRSRLEKLAARALISNRITMGLVALAIVALTGVASMMFLDLSDVLGGGGPFLLAGALYFGVAAIDDWRVRGRKFAERPSVLLRFDPIHHQYLDPL